MAAASSLERVVVVTGASSGIGLEVARGVAARGARTVMVGRGFERIQGIAADVARATGNPAVEGIGVEDLAQRSEWRRLSETLLQRYPTIHVLVNNAGAYYARREVTADGIERTLALNVLAPLALTTLLAHRLKESGPARVVNVASAAHAGNAVDLDDLAGTNGYRGYRAYGRSKLELILLTRELARRFAGSGVTVNAVHPGFIRSGFGQNNGGGTAFAIRLFARLAGKSLRHGARTPIHLALDPDVAGASGAYFVNRRVDPGSAASRDFVMAQRLYERCLALLQLPPIPEPFPKGSGLTVPEPLLFPSIT